MRYGSSSFEYLKHSVPVAAFPGAAGHAPPEL
jgi:hypothetical protein